MEENKKLRRILVEDLKVPSDKLQTSNEDKTKHNDPCSDCIECQRQGKKWTWCYLLLQVDQPHQHYSY